MTRLYLVQDYAGGMRIRYAGKNQGIAEERIRLLMRAGWERRRFVTVRAASQAEAFERAEPRLIAANHPDWEKQ